VAVVFASTPRSNKILPRAVPVSAKAVSMAPAIRFTP